MAGEVVIDLFTTLDGVVQAPGGPDEDREGGFALGGWQAPLIDAAVGAQVVAGIEEMDALLLGRRTYDIFAGCWPHQLDGQDSRIAALRERHRSVHVIGSAALARTLVGERLFDVLDLWVHPVVLGPGERLFPDDGPPVALTLLEPPVTSGKGAVLLRHGSAGDVTTGDTSAEERRP